MEKFPKKPMELQHMTLTTVSERHAVKVNEVIKVEDGPPLVMVRADVLLPMLVYLRKFFGKVQRTDKNAPSRFVDPEDFELKVSLKGFTPEDFNGLMSLSNSMGVELTDLLDQVKTPQMARPESAEDRKRILGAGERVKALAEGRDMFPGVLPSSFYDETPAAPRGNPSDGCAAGITKEEARGSMMLGMLRPDLLDPPLPAFKTAAVVEPSCTSEHVVTSQRVFASATGVGFRFEFCCREHAPLPWLEVEMTPDGAGRFVHDITAAIITVLEGGSDGGKKESH